MYSWLFVSQSGGDSVEELLEVDFSSFGFQIGNHVEDGGVFRLES